MNTKKILLALALSASMLTEMIEASFLRPWADLLPPPAARGPEEPDWGPRPACFNQKEAEYTVLYKKAGQLLGEIEHSANKPHEATVKELLKKMKLIITSHQRRLDELTGTVKKLPKSNDRTAIQSYLTSARGLLTECEDFHDEMTRNRAEYWKNLQNTTSKAMRKDSAWRAIAPELTPDEADLLATYAGKGIHKITTMLLEERTEEVTIRYKSITAAIAHCKSIIESAENAKREIQDIDNTLLKEVDEYCKTIKENITRAKRRHKIAGCTGFVNSIWGKAKSITLTAAAAATSAAASISYTMGKAATMDYLKTHLASIKDSWCAKRDPTIWENGLPISTCNPEETVCHAALDSTFKGLTHFLTTGYAKDVTTVISPATRAFERLTAEDSCSTTLCTMENGVILGGYLLSGTMAITLAVKCYKKLGIIPTAIFGLLATNFGPTIAARIGDAIHHAAASMAGIDATAYAAIVATTMALPAVAYAATKCCNNRVHMQAARNRPAPQAAPAPVATPALQAAPAGAGRPALGGDRGTTGREGHIPGGAPGHGTVGGRGAARGPEGGAAGAPKQKKGKTKNASRKS
jgi:hypothetical protein